MATERPFNPLLLASLQLEAEAISVVISEIIDRGFADLSNQVAMWQPRECPSRDEWE